LEKARRERQEIAALITSVKYKLIHSDWRALRDDDLEQFVFQVFKMLGYNAQITNKPDQGVDLVITGNGITLAVQAKGYLSSVGNHSVMEVVAGMSYYQCTSCAVITNSRFTRAAEQLANVNGCRLIDCSQIPHLIEGRIY
jgi:restriction system protein